MYLITIKAIEISTNNGQAVSPPSRFFNDND